jgi:hypothetical protein
MLPHLICSRPMFIGGANDEPAQQRRERLFQLLPREEPCGFAGALGRRCRVLTTTGPTSVSIDLELRTGAVARAGDQ